MHLLYKQAMLTHTYSFNPKAINVFEFRTVISVILVIVLLLSVHWHVRGKFRFVSVV